MLTNQQSNHAPDVIPGFEHVKRFYDSKNSVYVAKILPGEYYITKNSEVIATVLGSCISVCITDRKNRVGGMNHFMLPEKKDANKWTASPVDQAARYGTYAMEHMINDLIKNGGKRNNFEIKMCGAGKIIASMTDIGQKNIEFIKTFLSNEGYDVISEDLGDIYPRKVRYYPMTGKLLIKKMENVHTNKVIEREEQFKNNINTETTAGEIELF